VKTDESSDDDTKKIEKVPGKINDQNSNDSSAPLSCLGCWTSLFCGHSGPAPVPDVSPEVSENDTVANGTVFPVFTGCPMNPHTHYCCIKHKLFSKIDAMTADPAQHRAKLKQVFGLLFKDLEKEAKNKGCAPKVHIRIYWKGKNGKVCHGTVRDGPRVALWNGLIDGTFDGAFTKETVKTPVTDKTSPGMTTVTTDALNGTGKPFEGFIEGLSVVAYRDGTINSQGQDPTVASPMDYYWGGSAPGRHIDDILAGKKHALMCHSKEGVQKPCSLCKAYRTRKEIRWGLVRYN